MFSSRRRESGVTAASVPSSARSSVSGGKRGSTAAAASARVAPADRSSRERVHRDRRRHLDDDDDEDGGPLFSNSLQLADDDIDLFLAVELLREKNEKKRKTETSYRAPYQLRDTGDHSEHTSPTSASRHAVSHSGIVSSAFASDIDASRSTSARLKSRSHRCSHASASAASIVAAAVATAAAPCTPAASSAESPTTAISPLPSTMPMPSPTTLAPPPAIARKRVRSASGDVKHLAEAVLAGEMQKMAVNGSTATSVSGADIIMTSSPPPESKDTVTNASLDDDDEEVQIRFHDESPSEPPSPPVAAPASVPFSRVSSLALLTSATPPPRPPPFAALASVPRGLAHILSFLDLASLGASMGVSRRFRDLALAPRESEEARTLWRGSTWAIGGGVNGGGSGGTSDPSKVDSSVVGVGVVSSSAPSRTAAKVLSRLHQTYGVQECHAEWIVAPNPPPSFLLSRLEHLRLAQDETEATHPHSALVDAHFVLLPYFASLRTLDLSRVGARAFGATPLSPRLTAVTMARIALLGSSLQTLILDHCTEWVDDLALACLRSPDHVRQMRLPTDQFRFLPATTRMPQLRILSLEACTRVTARGLEYLVADGGVPALREISLAHCPKTISAESLAALRWNAPSLQVANLSWCAPPVGGASDPSDALRPLFRMPSLTALDLRGWATLRDQGLSSLCASSSSSPPPLIALSLRECGVGSTGLQSLAVFTALQSLDLSDSRGVGDDVLRVFGARLPYLRAIVLWNAPAVTDDGVEALLFGGGPATTPVAEKSLVHSLRCFRISSNAQLTSRTCTLLARCTRMAELELSDLSGIGEGGLLALANSASVGGSLATTLVALHLSRLGSAVTRSFGGVLNAFTALRELDASWNDGLDDATLGVLLGSRGPTRLARLNLSRCSLGDAAVHMLALHATRLAGIGERLEVDLTYCPRLSHGAVQAFRRAHKRALLTENLAACALTPSSSPGFAAVSPLTSAVSPTTPLFLGLGIGCAGGSSGSAGSPDSSPDAWTFRIEDQIVPDEDESDEEDEEEDDDDDDDDDDDEEDSDDTSMSGDPKFAAVRVEQDETGEQWDVHG